VNAAAFRAALRIARRDAWRAKWRSLLVIALIGLPVLVLSLADVAWRTYQLEPEQELTREIGAADALIQPTGQSAPVIQAPQAWKDGYNYQTSGDGGRRPRPRSCACCPPARGSSPGIATAATSS
jgi:putative ABC transport system permease protein